MDLELMARAMDAYSETGDDGDRARLAFFTGLYGLEERWAHRVAGEFGYAVPAADEVEARYWSVDPILSSAPVIIDADAFAGTLSDVAAYIAAEAGLEQRVADALKGFDWTGFCSKADLGLAGKDPAAFLEACLSDLEALDVPSDIPASILSLVVTCALRAWLQPAAQEIMKLAPADQTAHNRPLDCPVCGTPAAASFVGEGAGSDGRGRMQYCATCGTQWEFERIRCGVCGTQNQRKLHYFNLEGDDAHRIQSCDECGQYQRVVFQDDIPGPLCMEVEDVVMAKLDQVALDPRFRKEA